MRFLSPRASFLRVLGTSLLCAILLVTTATAWVAFEVRHDLIDSLPPVENFTDVGHRKITRILSSDGKLVATLFKENYQPVAFEAMGSNIVEAVIGIEDQRFYTHHGVDYRGIARAAVGNLLAGSVEQGASTITMQLARHLYLSDERSYERKLREALLAQKIEKQYSKKEILERYLNEVYFGSGAHGIGAASSRYFATTPANLTVAQAALLAGLIQSPSRLNPLTNYRAARHRQVEVLTALRENDLITPDEFYQARQESNDQNFLKTNTTAGQPILKYPYFTSFAAKKLVEQFGEDQVYNGGLTVTTTLDRGMQSSTDKVLSQMLADKGPVFGVKNGAAVVIENKTGYIRAMVGGQSWSQGDQFNRAWQAERQPGSVFKPFLFATALEMGYTEDSILKDEKVSILVEEQNGETKVWSPINSDGREKGNIPLREALRLSRNQATVALFTKVGLSRLIEMAKRVGVQSELPRVPSLALGTGLVTPLEMAQAFSTFANEGVKRESTALLTVSGPSGRLFADLSRGWSQQATSPQVAHTLTDMLRRVTVNGTGTAAYLPNIDTVGKTGTTDSYKDAWFVGYTPKYTVAVWMGNDDGTPTNRMYGGELPAIAWRKIVAQLDHTGEQRFPYFSRSPIKVLYCRETNLPAGPGCKKTEVVAYNIPAPKTKSCQTCLTAPKTKKKRTVELDLLDIQPDYPTALSMHP